MYDLEFTPRRFCDAWIKSVRKVVINVPYLSTHSNLLPIIGVDLSPELQLHVKFLKVSLKNTNSLLCPESWP
jgi:hypothetical protein